MPPRVRALAVVLFLLPVLLVGSPASAATPSYTMEERAFAIASPSLVFIENRLSGFVRKTETGTTVHAKAVSLTYRCTGFVVESQGHVVTTNHCVQPSSSSVVASALSLIANDLIKNGQLAEDQKQVYIKDNQAGAEFTGERVGSKPDQRVTGQLFQGQSGLSTEPAMQGELIDFLPTEEGNVALLRFSQGGMPSVQLASDAVQVTEPVVLAAFGRDSGSAIYTPRSLTARISGRIGTDAPAVYQLDSDLGRFSHGGVVAGSSGRVLGMITADIGRSSVNRVVGSFEPIQTLLGRAGVTNALAATDEAYRAGLNDYFGGRYSAAIAKLDSVLAVMPDHVHASHYRKQATERFAIEGDQTDQAGSKGWMWAAAGLGATQLISIGLIVWLFLRRRSMVSPASLYQPVSALPISAYPISGAPVSGGYTTAGYVSLTPPTEPPAALSEADGTDKDNPWAPRQ